MLYVYFRLAMRIERSLVQELAQSQDLEEWAVFSLFHDIALVFWKHCGSTLGLWARSSHEYRTVYTYTTHHHTYLIGPRYEVCRRTGVQPSAGFPSRFLASDSHLHRTLVSVAARFWLASLASSYPTRPALVFAYP